MVRNQEEYDKQLLALSTGLLAVLVAFLKDVVHLDTAVDGPLIYAGLASLGLTIVLVIISFQLSNHALEKVREYYEKRYKGINEDFPEIWSRRVKYFNWAAGISFVAGVSLTIAFIAINLANQSKLEAKDETYQSSGRCSDKDPDPKRCREGRPDQGTGETCPQGEYCSYHHRYVEDDEIGIPMSKNNSTAHDGAILKNPITTSKNAGPLPKKPISSGSSKKK